jgi:hypothetical protein
MRGERRSVKPNQRRFVTLSGWVSLIANLLAIGGFLFERWPFPGWQANPGFWIVLSFVTTAYSLVIWSIWIWDRSGVDPPGAASVAQTRSGLFLLNAMAVLPALTVWFYLVLAVLDNAALTITLRWILALAIAWAGTPFVAMGLTWTGSTLGPLAAPRSGDQPAGSSSAEAPPKR